MKKSSTIDQSKEIGLCKASTEFLLYPKEVFIGTPSKACLQVFDIGEPVNLISTSLICQRTELVILHAIAGELEDPIGNPTHTNFCPVVG